MKRIINKQTGMYLRDDLTFNKETEIGLDVTPAQGFYHPKWDGLKWVEGLTDEEIQVIKSRENLRPTIEERLIDIEHITEEIITKLND